MKRLLWLAFLLPLFVQAQVNGTIQKTSATGIVRGSFGSSGLDSLLVTNGAGVNGYVPVFKSALKKSVFVDPATLISGTYVPYSGWTSNLNGGSRLAVAKQWLSTLTATIKSVILFIGDSLTQGVGGSPNPTPYTNYLVLDRSFDKINLGVGGRTAATMRSMAPLTDTLFRPQAREDIAVIQAGTNDLDLGASADSTYNSIVALCRGRQVSGFKVVVLTIIAYGGTVDSGSAIQDSINKVNTLIRATWPEFADNLSDVAASAAFYNALDLTYYSGDGIHPNNTGYGVYADSVEVAINRMATQTTLDNVVIKGSILTGLRVTGSEIISGAYGTTLNGITINNTSAAAQNNQSVLSFTGTDGFRLSGKRGSIRGISEGTGGSTAGAIGIYTNPGPTGDTETLKYTATSDGLLNASSDVSSLFGNESLVTKRYVVATFQPVSTRTTVGNNFYTLANPSAITFPRINADNTVSALDAATFRTAIGAGTSTVTPASLTKTDDTNVTLTLGGTPTTALLQATSVTAGWTGTLAVARGGTGTGSAGIGAVNNISGQSYSGFTGTGNLMGSASPTTTGTFTGDASIWNGDLVVQSTDPDSKFTIYPLYSGGAVGFDMKNLSGATVISGNGNSGAIVVGTAGTLGIGGIANSINSTTYTPTTGNVSNAASSSATVTHVIRVGAEVSFSGTISVTTAGTGTGTVSITLPSGFTSDFTTSTDARGNGVGDLLVSGIPGCWITADATSDLIYINYQAASATTYNINFTGHYTIK